MSDGPHISIRRLGRAARGGEGATLEQRKDGMKKKSRSTDQTRDVENLGKPQSIEPGKFNPIHSWQRSFSQTSRKLRDEESQGREIQVTKLRSTQFSQPPGISQSQSHVSRIASPPNIVFRWTITFTFEPLIHKSPTPPEQEWCIGECTWVLGPVIRLMSKFKALRCLRTSSSGKMEGRKLVCD